MLPVSIVTNEDNMIMMARYPDKWFELAIVDPPYGIGAENQAGPENHGWTQWPKKEWDRSIPAFEYFTELFRVSKNQIIWGGNYFTLPIKQSWIFWDKLTGKNDFSDGELAWSSFGGALRKYTQLWLGSNARDADGRIHPTQKPVALYKWLLSRYAKPGDKILDTHLGSGSSRIAAYDLGFDFYACELDADYFQAQEKRFADYLKQPKLIEEPIQTPKEQALFPEAAE